MFKFIRKFFEFENRLNEFRIELDVLKDVLDDIRKERDEFKQIIFRKFGLVETESIPRENIAPIQRRPPVHRVLHDLTVKDREEYWNREAERAEKALKEKESELTPVQKAFVKNQDETAG
jgi:hypothetical protein